MTSSRVEGLDDLEAAIRDAVERMAAGAAAAVNEGARSVQADIRVGVGVDTGHERAAIEIRDDGPTGAEVGVFDEGVDYEQYGEFGTSRQPARPVFGPAADAERLRLSRRVADHIRRALP